jgi:hypothetical protein
LRSSGSHDRNPLVRAGAFLIVAGAVAVPAAAADAPICPDRPSKGTGTCTVPAGDWQVEIALVDWTRDHSGGTSSDFTTIGASLIKYGLSDRADVELGVVPYERASADGARSSGFGDLVVRTKVRVTGGDAAIQIAVDPFVKLPTAKHDLGNGQIEAGIVVPVGVALGGPLSLGFAPEIDWRADGEGHGRHAAMVQLIDLGLAASDRLSLTAELWAQWDWDPAGAGRQVSADGAAAYLVGDNVQLDAGANFGLNRETPDIELYSGVSARF